MTDQPLSFGAAGVPENPDRVRAVKRRIAAAMLPPLPPAALGEVRLLPHQRQAAARLRRILQRHGGALLADDVGLGKTFAALAVAQHYECTHILAPAGLIAMWQAAVVRTAQRDVAVHSLHRASRHPLPHFAASGHDTVACRVRPLVIVDEAHALRNADTTRYRHVASAVSGCDVLLLSATPLHNSPRDLATLFALFRGPDAERIPDDVLASLIVRRHHRQIHGRMHRGHRPRPLPSVRTHRPFTVPQQRETLDRLLTLPAPLPARDGAVAGALIRLGLLRAWCSSDAALTQALTKRLQRGTAMRDALDAGRLLSNAELGSWIIGDDPAGDMQLGFAELLSSHTVEPDGRHSALHLLGKHCDALRDLREHHLANARADEVRAGYLRTVCERHAGTPVVAFSQHARTVQALFRALSDIAGVGMLTSRQARIASGPVTRPELLGWFAPRAQGRPPPPPSLRLHLLLTTDLIAEGVNLQDAGVVVHLDLPWTHALRVQRTGRVVRLGSPHRLAHVYRLRAARAVRQVLRAERRVAHKAALAARLVGDRDAHATVARRSAVDHASRWERCLLHWACNVGADTAERTRWPRMATIRSSHGVTGAVVLVQTVHGARLLACVLRGSRWWISTRADALVALSQGTLPARLGRSQASSTATIRPSAVRPPAVRPPAVISTLPVLRRVVRRWWRREQAAAIAGIALAAGAANSATTGQRLNRTQREAMTWLRRRVADRSTVERASIATYVREAQAMIARASGAGAAAALRSWMAEPVGGKGDALPDWRVHPELCHEAPPTGTRLGDSPELQPRVGACLWVRPA